MSRLACLKVCEVHGRLGDEFNEDIVYRIGRAYAQHLNTVHMVDRLSCEFPEWSFNLRVFNTKPLLRLNVSRVNAGIAQERFAELETFIKEGA